MYAHSYERTHVHLTPMSTSEGLSPGWAGSTTGKPNHQIQAPLLNFVPQIHQIQQNVM
jgi:hypothetical protein